MLSQLRLLSKGKQTAAAAAPGNGSLDGRDACGGSGDLASGAPTASGNWGGGGGAAESGRLRLPGTAKAVVVLLVMLQAARFVLHPGKPPGASLSHGFHHRHPSPATFGGDDGKGVLAGVEGRPLSVLSGPRSAFPDSPGDTKGRRTVSEQAQGDDAAAATAVVGSQQHHEEPGFSDMGGAAAASTAEGGEESGESVGRGEGAVVAGHGAAVAVAGDDMSMLVQESRDVEEGHGVSGDGKREENSAGLPGQGAQEAFAASETAGGSAVVHVRGEQQQQVRQRRLRKQRRSKQRKQKQKKQKQRQRQAQQQSERQPDLVSGVLTAEELFGTRQSSSPVSRAAPRATLVMLYRILGNDIPPFHSVGQVRQNLEYILQHEATFEGCEKRWVLNRISNDTEKLYIMLLLRSHGYHKHQILDIPLDIDALARMRATTSSLSSSSSASAEANVQLTHELADTLPSHLASEGNFARFLQQGRDYIGLNEARNLAVADGVAAGARWVMCLDGGQFVPTPTWKSVLASAVRRSGSPRVRYIEVPVLRLKEPQQPTWLHAASTLDDILPHCSTRMDEGQLVLRNDTLVRFDQDLVYSLAPKEALLERVCSSKSRICVCHDKLPWWKVPPSRIQARVMECGATVRLWTFPQPQGQQIMAMAGVQRRNGKILAVQRYVDAIDARVQQRRKEMQQAGGETGGEGRSEEAAKEHEAGGQGMRRRRKEGKKKGRGKGKKKQRRRQKQGSAVV